MDNDMENTLAFITLTAFAVTAVAELALLPLLRRLKMGQSILEIGPSWHMHKQGTPTMGGAAFLMTALFILGLGTVAFGFNDKLFIYTILYACLNGAVGALDDTVKLKRRRNEGLSASAKLFYQLLLSSAYLLLLWRDGLVNGSIYIPFVGISASLGAFYIPIGVLFLSGFTNAVNLSDGLDGLCSSVTAACSLALCLLAVRFGQGSGAAVMCAVLGMTLAFLIFNRHPAKVFMGDTGSLFLGAAISAVSLTELGGAVLLVVGGVYLWEALSVILQVGWYKLTKKRLFLMAPYHHHLERKGKSEVWITSVFTAVTLLLGALTYAFA